MSFQWTEASKSRLASALILMLTACSGSNFEGGGKSSKSGTSNSTSKAGPQGGSQSGPDDGSSVPIGSPAPLANISGGMSTACNITPAYNPQSILCSITVGDPNNGWDANHGGSWTPFTSKFRDRTAKWISPLAAFNDGGGHMLCPHVPQSEKLIYVSFVDVPAAGSYFMEALDDDAGVAQLWKDTDPTKATGKFSVTAGGNTTTTLEKARYMVVVDGIDSGTASAVAFSLQDGTGKVIKNSTPDNSWCIFRVAASENTENFVNANVGCLPCSGRVK